MKLFESRMRFGPSCRRAGGNQHPWPRTPALPSRTTEETPGTVSSSKAKRKLSRERAEIKVNNPLMLFLLPGKATAIVFSGG